MRFRVHPGPITFILCLKYFNAFDARYGSKWRDDAMMSAAGHSLQKAIMGSCEQAAESSVVGEMLIRSAIRQLAQRGFRERELSEAALQADNNLMTYRDTGFGQTFPVREVYVHFCAKSLLFI